MKRFEDLHDLNSNILNDAVQGFYEQMYKDTDSKPLDKFDEIIGGDVFLVETLADMAEIKGLNPDSEDVEYMSILEGLPRFDVAMLFDDLLYALFVLISNDAGGNCYLVPPELLDQVPNARTVLALTKEQRPNLNN